MASRSIVTNYEIFATTKFNNCLITEFVILWRYLWEAGKCQIALWKVNEGIYRAWAELICCQTLSQTQLDDIAHKQTIICRQLRKGRQPTTWPANNCLQKMVCSCAMSSNCMCSDANNILLMLKRNHAFLLLAIALAWNWQIASLIHFIANSVIEW